MATGGDVGQPPPEWIREEWRIIQLAKWLGCKPWELDDVPAAWLTICGFYMSIEHGARQVEKVTHG